MERLETVIGFLEAIFPSSLAFPSDPTGLQIKGQDQVEKILVALELNPRVFRQAITENYDFSIFITHPFGSLLLLFPLMTRGYLC